MKQWIISDTHFGHTSIGRFAGRPEGWQATITRNWKMMVDENDTIYHLGDFSLCNKADYRKYIEALPGRKILILGNHDKFSRSFYLNNGWDLVVDSLTVGNLILTHAPIMNLPNGYYNVHGHVHDGAHTVMRHNVCVDIIGLKPLNFAKVRSHFSNDTEEYSYRRGWGMKPSYGVGNDVLNCNDEYIEFGLSEDHGEWIVECQTYPGIIAYGDDKHEAIDKFKEAVISYLKDRDDE